MKILGTSGPRSLAQTQGQSQDRSRRPSRRTLDPGELNTAIVLLLDRLNHNSFKKRFGSRLSAFEAIDQPELQWLPEPSYV
jgi:hypothetical protein